MRSAGESPGVADSCCEIPLFLESPKFAFASFDELFELLQDFHRASGTAIVKRRSGKKRNVDGVPTITSYGLICDRGIAARLGGEMCARRRRARPTAP